MKIGGQPDRLILLKDTPHVDWQSLPQPIRVLGNGSNTLIDDRGLKGTVIVTRDLAPVEPEVLSEDGGTTRIRVSAGTFLPTLCRWTEKKSLTGCEYMIGVPGTVGGALSQNAGANDQDFSMICESADMISLESGERTTVAAENLKWSYRKSLLKERVDWLCVSVVLKLQNSAQFEIESRIERNLSYRKMKTPFQRPSLGSVFKRLNLSDNEWIYPGAVIEQLGLKGKRQNGAQISPVHANYITNEGGATFDDVMMLIHEVEGKAKSQLNLTMEREILIWSDRTGGI